jgi:Na+/melibiose symporter-like transporter
MGSPLDHEFRSRELADSLRNFLLTVNTGAIGLLFSIAASLISKDIKAGWLICPTMFFVCGLIFCATSIFLAQHRELKRKEAAKNNLEEPDFYFLKRSYVWHIASFASFIIGVGIALFKLQSLL